MAYDVPILSVLLNPHACTYEYFCCLLAHFGQLNYRLGRRDLGKSKCIYIARFL